MISGILSDCGIEYVLNTRPVPTPVLTIAQLTLGVND